MKPNSILSFVIPIIIVAAGIFWYVSSRTGNEAALTAVYEQSQTQTQFQALVSQLSSISFDTSIFSDPHFAALVDLSTPIAPEPAGRVDPFAAITAVPVSAGTR